MQCSKGDRAGRADRRREHILNVARTLFAERGFHSTGVAQIATASGIAIGQIYRDFQSKEDIIAAIVERDVEEFLGEDALGCAIARGNRVAVRQWIERLIIIDESNQDCRLMCEIMAEMGRNDRIAGINREVERRVRVSIGAALRALAGEAIVPSAVERLTDLVMLLSIGLVCRQIADPALDIVTLSGTLSRIVDEELAQIAGGTGALAVR